MSFITINEIPIKSRITYSDKIPVGTIFTGKIGFHNDKLFVKIHNQDIRSLDRDYENGIVEDKYWDSEKVPIENYKPVISITVTV
jgi:hypothetical protein